MKPEHEEFLLEHVKQMGFVFIIDCLKERFPELAHDQACRIYDEFKAKHAENELVKKSDKQLKGLGNAIGGEIEKIIRRRPK